MSSKCKYRLKHCVSVLSCFTVYRYPQVHYSEWVDVNPDNTQTKSALTFLINTVWVHCVKISCQK